MPDYSKSKVYKIVCNITGETYYGSTTQSLARRLSGHKANINNVRPASSKQIIDRGNYNIVLCEECSCENKEQLYAIERRWIEANECINKIIPTRTHAEWKNDNPDYHRDWRLKNKVKLSEKYQSNIEAHKKYCAENYQKNKEARLNKAKLNQAKHYAEKKKQA